MDVIYLVDTRQLEQAELLAESTPRRRNSFIAKGIISEYHKRKREKKAVPRSSLIVHRLTLSPPI